MSKHVDKRHGLSIGSNNIFCVVGDGEFRDGYRAIVTLRGYNFNQYDTINVRIWTPAQQILWDEVEYVEEREFEGRKWQEPRRGYVLKSWWRNWLTTNVGDERVMWDVRARYERRSEPLFFKRRTDALAFCQEIDRRLKGIKFADV